MGHLRSLAGHRLAALGAGLFHVTLAPAEAPPKPGCPPSWARLIAKVYQVNPAAKGNP
jgi:hypothetical protein